MGSGHNDALYLLAGFPVGCAVNVPKLLDHGLYRDTFLREFSSATTENIFKANLIHPREDVFNWGPGDELVKFCRAHGKRIHGHTLVWGEEVPSWMERLRVSREDWILLMQHHIQSVMHHYNGAVAGWDVVNEAFGDNGLIKENFWQQKIGNEYIELAFRFAREADPSAALFYNDHSLEYNTVKRDAVISFLNNLRMKGVSVDGMGLQVHCDIYAHAAMQLGASLSRLSEDGFLVHISELDVRVNPACEDVAFSARTRSDLLERQAVVMADIFALYLKVPARLKYGVTCWGIGDNDSWIRHRCAGADFPLLFDEEYRPKAAYFALRALFKANDRDSGSGKEGC